MAIDSKGMGKFNPGTVALICAAMAFVTGCGGTEQTADQQGAPSPTPMPTADPAAMPTPSPAPSTSAAKIHFPWQRSTATARTMTVGGTASDSDGIARVMVNGVDATITANAAGTKSLKTSVDWSAQITLEIGDNLLNVSVEDSNGEVAVDVGTALVHFVEVPTTFSIDPAGTRVVGVSSSLTSMGFKLHLVEYNYGTNQQTIFRELQAAPISSCLRNFENELLWMMARVDGYALFSYDMTTDQESMITTIPTSALSGDEGFQDGSPRELVCGGTHNNAYVLVHHYTPDFSSKKSRILEIDLATTAVTTLADSGDATEPGWFAWRIALAEHQIVAIDEFGSPAPLTSIALTDGAASDPSPGLEFSGVAVYPDIAADRVYVATLDGVDEVDLIDLTKRNISPVAADDPLSFSQVRALGFDPANNRVIVGESDLDMLIAVDIANGDRSEILARSAGAGVKMIAPRRLALTSDGSRAYVFDDGGNNVERLFEVELSTGDRRTIGDIKQAFNNAAMGMALDEPGNRVFVAYFDRILEVNLGTEHVRKVADVDSTPLTSFGRLLLDSANGRLLVSDGALNGIFAMDLASGAFSVVSQDGRLGAGPPFADPASLSGPTAAGEIYVANYANESVIRVNLETGDRELVDETCHTPGQGLNQALYNEEANELLLLGFNIFRLDLDSGTCTRLPGNAGGLLLRIQNVSEAQLLGTTFGALVQIDRKTGEIVFVSR